MQVQAAMLQVQQVSALLEAEREASALLRQQVNSLDHGERLGALIQGEAVAIGCPVISHLEGAGNDNDVAQP